MDFGDDDIACICPDCAGFNVLTTRSQWNRRAADEAVKKAADSLNEITSLVRDTQTCSNEDKMWGRAVRALAALKEVE